MPETSTANPQAKLRWYQFRLRTLLIVILLVSFFMSWVAVRIERGRSITESMTALQKTFPTNFNKHYLLWSDKMQGYQTEADPPGPAWLRKILGENFFADEIGLLLTLDSTHNSDALKKILDLPKLSTLGIVAQELNASELEIIGRRTDLISLNLRTHSLSEECKNPLCYLRNMTRLKWLNFNHSGGFQRLFIPSFSFRLQYLVGMKQLENLSLGSMRIEERDFKYLSELKKLSRLSFVSVPLTGEGLSALRGVPPLKNLDVSKTELTDEGLKNVVELTEANLDSLDLNNTKITNEGLKYLMKLKKVGKLNLSYTAIDDEGLRNIKELRGVCFLDLRKTSITDKGIAYILAMKTPMYLDLSETKITDEGLKQIPGKHGLVEVELEKTAVTDSGLNYLLAFKYLHTINLSDTAVTDEGLKTLQKMKRLQYVDLRNTKATPAGVQELQKALPQLKITYP